MVHFLELNTSWAIWLTIMNDLLCHQPGPCGPACNHVLLLAGTSLTIGLLSTFLQWSFRNKGNLLINPIDLKATVINAFSLLLASKLFECISHEPPLITNTPPHSIGFLRGKKISFLSPFPLEAQRGGKPARDDQVISPQWLPLWVKVTKLFSKRLIKDDFISFYFISKQCFVLSPLLPVLPKIHRSFLPKGFQNHQRFSCPCVLRDSQRFQCWNQVPSQALPWAHPSRF